ncbi:uncharacterized protein PV09_04096 [Verruconis gallopava]|uniref:Uncharacterized protein n=1 Tax=Verruconis gallopava TaxID=253628 RepID=A0A0D2ADA5_9PEZI|nr:uncharacterized protein PV09_04096 [Verruconis gallopava]KIW04928.1 hypothetical protein PV09_04096 [Verruconis gallopava]
MSSLKDIAKGGWHPKGKDGGKESWRGDFKGIDQVAGWMGKKKTSDYGRAQEHTSTPLNQLKDPASFGPPPKRNTYGSSAAGGSTTQASPSSTIPGTRLTSSTGGLGSPLTREQLEEDRRLAAQRVESQRRIEEEPKHPTGPYRADTTGLSTAGLPPPPKFRGASSTSPEKGAVAKPPPPSLPPRLPPRQAAAPLSPPPAYSQQSGPENGVLNHGAVSRLGAAGVKVPALGIGASNSSASPPPPPGQSPTAGTNASQLSELQSRFSRLNSGSTSPSAATADSSAQGTTWAQKQAALKTASNFHKDPTSVSLSDARNAASTANNFRERHGEQIASGWRAASGLNQKYGISDRLSGGAAASSAGSPSSGPTGEHEQETGVVGASAAGKKKPPPPPPVKRVGLGGAGPSVPPPVPLASKPSVP